MRQLLSHKGYSFYSKVFRLWVLLLLSVALFASATGCSTTPKKAEAASQESSALGPYEKLEKADRPSVVAVEKVSDPLEPMNRGIFYFNHYLYKFLLTPLAEGYQYIMPKFLSKGIGQIFTNLREPLYSLSHLVQLEFGNSGKALARFGVNSTVGLLGFFDPAKSWLGIESRSSTLGEALASYGLGHGFYLVLPILGPSDLLTAPTYVFEYFVHPLNIIEDNTLVNGLFIYEGFHIQAPRLAKYDEITEDLKDPYVFLRNYYMSTRLVRFDQLKGEFGDTNDSTEVNE